MFHRSRLFTTLFLAASLPAQAWFAESPNQSPDARRFHSMVFASHQQLTWMFGGIDEKTGKVFADTWAYDGRNWHTSTSTAGVAPRPEARSRHAACYDTRRKQMLVFGGQDGQGQALAELWSFDGQLWTHLDAGLSQGPAPRVGAAMCFDPVLSRSLLSGGYDPATGKHFDDTWAFVGGRWQQLLTTQPLPARHGHTMTWVPGLQTAVVFGGREAGASGFNSETYRLDRQGWRRLQTSTTPQVMIFPAATYNPFHQVLVVCGAVGSMSPGLSTWVFDGSDWQRGPSPAKTLWGRQGHGLAFDSVRDTAVLFGGGSITFGGIRPHQDTWELGTEAQVESIGQGCATKAGQLELSISGKPQLGAPVQLRLGPLPGPVLPWLFFGELAKPGVTLPGGCPLLVDMNVFLLMPPAPKAATLDLVVPANPSLIGDEIAVQGYLGGPERATSNALNLRIGN